MRKAILIFAIAALFAGKVEIREDILHKTDALMLEISDDTGRILRVDIREKDGLFTADVPTEFHMREDLRGTVISNTDTLYTDEPLLRILEPMETEELGLTLGKPGDHVNFEGDFFDMNNKRVENVATPTSADSIVGPAVSTKFLFGEVKSESSSYKFYSR